jgi:hypothetical protein
MFMIELENDSPLRHRDTEENKRRYHRRDTETQRKTKSKPEGADMAEDTEG